MTRRSDMPTLLSVYDGRDYLGCILARGKLGFEAFDRDERTLGFFGDHRAAADAITQDFHQLRRDIAARARCPPSGATTSKERLNND